MAVLSKPSPVSLGVDFLLHAVEFVLLAVNREDAINERGETLGNEALGGGVAHWPISQMPKQRNRTVAPGKAMPRDVPRPAELADQDDDR
jgi:hypothetical protein